jgi:biopolymer transport protein ExbB/TolQ
MRLEIVTAVRVTLIMIMMMMIMIIIWVLMPCILLGRANILEKLVAFVFRANVYFSKKLTSSDELHSAKNRKNIVRVLTITPQLATL